MLDIPIKVGDLLIDGEQVPGDGAPLDVFNPVAINGGWAQHPDALFGGFTASGIGRKGGEGGIREFLEPQHVQWAL